MGLAPLNKLYAMMMTLFAFVKIMNIRATIDRIQSFTSSNLQLFLVAAGAAGVIFGPAIGFFDTYYDHPVHVKVT